MIAAGSVSGYSAYVLGRGSLKGVTQPDINPTKKLASNKSSSEKPNQLTFVSERDVIVKVYDHIHQQGGTAGEDKPDTETDSKKEKDTEEKDTEGTETPANDDFTKATNSEDASFIKPPIDLPIRGKDQDVTMEIVNISQEAGSLSLDVNLKNDGRKSVRFLYSFLDVRDDQDRALSAITDGLPGELPANGESFSGTVKIPTALLEDTQKISLILTDYPDQKLQLKISDIPVVK
jgi:hypothetical protein